MNRRPPRTTRTDTLCPSTTLFRPLATVSGPAAAAAGVLTLALKGLLVASVVGAAVLAVVEAFKFFTAESNEARAAANAVENQALRTSTALDVETKATDRKSVV